MLAELRIDDLPRFGSEDYEEAYHLWMETEYQPLAGGWQY